jgi:hypothetical protein
MVACGPPTKLRQVVRIPKTEVVGSSPISIDSLFALADDIGCSGNKVLMKNFQVRETSNNLMHGSAVAQIASFLRFSNRLCK